jgi:RNA polymerase sigma factor (sigma-70 family)
MDAITYDLMAVKRNEEVKKTVLKEQNRLFNFIRKSVRNIEDAQDILQDVFYQFITGYDEIRSAEKTTSWLYTVAKNKITDMFRKKKPVLLSERKYNFGGEEGILTIEDILPDPSILPDDEYFYTMLWEEIEDGLDELPDEQREVFVMHELEGKSFNEIAEITGVPLNTLLSRKRYAVLYLREHLQEFFNELKQN